MFRSSKLVHKVESSKYCEDMGQMAPWLMNLQFCNFMLERGVLSNGPVPSLKRGESFGVLSRKVLFSETWNLGAYKGVKRVPSGSWLM